MRTELIAESDDLNVELFSFSIIFRSGYPTSLTGDFVSGRFSSLQAELAIAQVSSATDERLRKKVSLS